MFYDDLQEWDEGGGGRDVQEREDTDILTSDSLCPTGETNATL